MVAVVAAILIAAKWAAQLWLDRLNEKHVRDHANAVPNAFKGAIDAETYAKSVRYTLAKGRFDQIELALRAVTRQAYAVLVIDRGLPDGDGLELVRQLRAAAIRTPCLMLTARDALHDRVEMLEDPIQFTLDHYELANWRLTEIGAARHGHVLEVLIVIILLADFGFRALDVLLPRVSLMFSTIIP